MAFSNSPLKKSPGSQARIANRLRTGTDMSWTRKDWIDQSLMVLGACIGIAVFGFGIAPLLGFELIADHSSICIVAVVTGAVCGHAIPRFVHRAFGPKASSGSPYLRLRAVEDVTSRIGRGVFKRIDENRELLQLLKERCPNVVENYPWIEGWLRSHDDFFVELAKVTQAANPFEHFKGNGEPVFPRPWPGTPRQ